MTADRTRRVGLCALVAVTLACPLAGAQPRTNPAPAKHHPPQLCEPVQQAAWRGVSRKLDKLATHGIKGMEKPAEAARFFHEQRLDLNEPYPYDQAHAALDEIRARQAQLATLRGGTNPGDITGWLPVGPGNIGGRTRSLLINPTNPQIMYAGGVAGGVWKSIDGGASWNPTDDAMMNLAIGSLAMDPANPDVLYAGTGEGYYLADVFVQGQGIFKSTDAGTTWTQLPGTVAGAPAGAFDYVNKIVISHNDSNRVYAATRTGVWRSLDAGATWSLRLGNPQYLSGPTNSAGCLVGATDLVIRDDTNPDVLFATFGSLNADGLYRSDDGGTTWLAYGVPANQGRTTIALAPSNNDIMYLLMADNGSGGAIGQLLSVFRSDDGGNNFTSQVDFSAEFGPYLLSNVILSTDCVPDGETYAQGWYDNIIAVDPLDPNTIWVGGVDLLRSTNAGQTYELTGYWFYGSLDPRPADYIHPDHHLVVFHPNYDGSGNQTIYIGCDGGLFRSDNALAPGTTEECPFCFDPNNPNCGFGPPSQIVWETLNNGYGVTQFYHGATHPDDVFIGGAQDNGTNKTAAIDTPDDWDHIFGGDGGYVAIDPRDSDTIYVEIQFFPEIRKSTDGGETFELAVDGITDTDGLFIAPFEIDKLRPDTLWTGSSRPWRTQDAAVSWQAVGPNFGGASQVSAIGISPTASRYVYLGYSNGYIARTTNGLQASPNWILRGSANGLPIGAWCSSVAVDPTDGDTAYATYSSFGVPHIYKTTNGGASWSNIDGIGVPGIPDIPVHWIAIRPCDSQQLYVGTEFGAFASDNGGASWDPVNLGLPNTVVESLTFQTNNTLVAFTHGRGTWLTRLAPCDSCPADVDGDGDSDLSDLAILLGEFGTAGIGTKADLNGDDIVDLTDLGILLANFGQQC